MEYVIVLLVIALIVALYFKKPSEIIGILSGSLVKKLKDNEAEIVYGLYNKLPKAVKDKVDSKTIAEIVGFAIDVIVDVLTGKRK